MKIKTSELTGVALDWAVAKCEGVEGFKFKDGSVGSVVLKNYSPSTDWAQGGPIIERERVDLRNTITEGGYRTSSSNDACLAQITLPNGAVNFDSEKMVFSYGPTTLIAAMRCYCCAKLGEEIEVPDDLT